MADAPRKKGKRTAPKPEGGTRKKRAQGTDSAPQVSAPSAPDSVRGPTPEEVLELQEDIAARLNDGTKPSYEDWKQLAAEWRTRHGPRWAALVLSTVNKLSVARTSAGLPSLQLIQIVVADSVGQVAANQGEYAVLQQAARDQLGALAGFGNTLLAGGNSNSTCPAWLQEAIAEPAARAPFEACFAELQGVCSDSTEAEELMQHFRQLCLESVKGVRGKSSLVRMAHGAISAVLPPGQHFPAWQQLGAMLQLR